MDVRVRAGDADDDEGLAIALRGGHCARLLKASWKFFYAFLEALQGVLEAPSRPKRAKIAPRWARNAPRAKYLVLEGVLKALGGSWRRLGGVLEAKMRQNGAKMPSERAKNEIPW